MEKSTQTRSAQENFGRLGWALIISCSVLLLISCLSLVLILVNGWMESSGKTGLLSYTDNLSMTYWLLFRFPIYAVGIPLAAAILKKLPRTPIPKKRFSAKQLIGYGLLAISIQTPVNFLTTIFVNAIYKDITLPFQAHAPQISFWVLLDLIVLSPVLEEFLFRKILLDRFRRYGERLAILVSAVTFGLLHMNLQQTMVTIVLGIILAYVYLRSGKIWYCILLHSASNCLSGGMMTLLLSRLSPRAWMLLQTQDEAFLTPDILSELSPLAGYLLFFCCLVMIGWIILIRNRKKTVFLPSEEELAPKQAATAVFGSVGMILYVTITLFVIITTIIQPFI